MKIKLIPSWVFIKVNNQERYIWFRKEQTSSRANNQLRSRRLPHHIHRDLSNFKLQAGTCKLCSKRLFRKNWALWPWSAIHRWYSQISGVLKYSFSLKSNYVEKKTTFLLSISALCEFWVISAVAADKNRFIYACWLLANRTERERKEA